MAACSSRPFAASIRVEDQRYVLPPFSSNPGDTEILERLLPLLERYHCIGQAGVNAGLPWWDPWDLPGMAPLEEEAKRREKYFVTDYSALKTSSTKPATPHGFWKPRDLGWGIPGEGIIGTARFAGVKRTYDFYTGETIYQEGIEGGTNWIMNVYFLIDQKNGHVEDDLVMCHVFESNSHDYDPRPRCAAHAQHDQSLKEKEEVYDQTVHAQSNISIFEGSATLLPTHISFNKPLSPPHHAPQRRCISHHKAPKENGSLTQHQELQLQNHSCHQYPGEPSHQAIHGQSNNSFNLRDTEFPPLSPLSIDCLENIANIMGNSCLQASMETENYNTNEGGSSTTVSASADTGPLGKRTRTNKTKSAVWGKFTKLLTKAKAVLAVCNHCCKVMTGDSSKGTSHLNRHKCTCNCNH